LFDFAGRNNRIEFVVGRSTLELIAGGENRACHSYDGTLGAAQRSQAAKLG
jgi:hypothetical protein